ncbi:F-box/kelch-repeat protein At3g23880-like [Silene latifolia]|uniref:F-box/kelch-repeat protein At3g23880-like n=1 Tax=Silene latifolia TaxID=37657 RepID=UPI003D78AD20
MKSSNYPTTSSKLQCISESKYVPPEIWTQILSNLPAKTLLKFRCVCKSWRFDIDNPAFAHLHYQNSENNKFLVTLKGLGYPENEECLLTIHDAQTLRKNWSIFIKYDSYTYRLIGSCNGLLLVERSAPQGNHKEFRLWNPCIHKSLILPTCPLSSSLLGCSWYLFGFAPDLKDYKVVVFGLDDGQGEDYAKMYFAVYTLSNQQWTVSNVIHLNATWLHYGAWA